MNGQRNGKKTDCSTGDMASSYCLIFPNNGENILLFVTPDDHMLDMIKRVAPRAFM